MKRTNIHIPEQARERMHRLAEKLGTAAAELYRRAIEEFLQRNKA